VALSRVAPGKSDAISGDSPSPRLRRSKQAWRPLYEYPESVAFRPLSRSPVFLLFRLRYRYRFRL